MNEILNLLEENPEIFEQLLNDDKNIEEVQKELLKQNHEVDKSTIKLIIQLMKNCIQNKDQSEIIGEKELENISGGIAVSKATINCIVAITSSAAGSYTGSKIGNEFSKKKIFLNRKNPTPEGEENTFRYWHRLGYKEGINATVGSYTGAAAGFFLQEHFKVTEKICNFLENHGVEIT